MRGKPKFAGTPTAAAVKFCVSEPQTTCRHAQLACRNSPTVGCFRRTAAEASTCCTAVMQRCSCSFPLRQRKPCSVNELCVALRHQRQGHLFVIYAASSFVTLCHPCHSCGMTSVCGWIGLEHGVLHRARLTKLAELRDGASLWAYLCTNSEEQPPLPIEPEAKKEEEHSKV